MVRVGFGQVDITPEPGMQMLGMPDIPRARGVAWPLQGRVLLAEAGAIRLAIVSLDLIALSLDQARDVRHRLAAAGGLPPAHITIACSHTHRAPFITPEGAEDGPAVTAFMDEVFTRLGTAMAHAAASMQSATLGFGTAQAPGWAFNRRPIFAGGQVGTHGWAWDTGFERMEGIPDEALRVLVAHDLDGAILGGLVNFACHPTAMGHDPVYSADYPGVLTEALEQRHGGVFGFLIGAAGDTSTPDPTSRDPESGFGPAHTLAMGRALAARADEAIAAARPVALDRLGVASTQVRIPQRRATEEEVTLARWYLEERPDDLDELEFTRRLYGHDYTFRDGRQVGNERHAQEILRMWDWQHGPDAQLVEEIEVQVLTLGDVAIVALPVELFTEIGRRIMADSPFPDTLIVTLANGWHGYVPTLEAFERGGYEPRLAFPSRLAPEAGDQLTVAALSLLGQLATPA